MQIPIKITPEIRLKAKTGLANISTNLSRLIAMQSVPELMTRPKNNENSNRLPTMLR